MAAFIGRRCHQSNNITLLMVGENQVNRGEQFPADVLIIGTSEPKGVLYVETKNLDGETNLKQKIACKEI